MSDKDSRIDWEKVRARLEQSRRALDKILTPNEENLEVVFRERAAQLARRGQQERTAGAALRVLVVGLGSERYALEFADLVELLPFAGCTRVPGGPPELLGVVNVNGEIRSVVDLGRLLQLSEPGPATGGYVLLLRRQNRQAAVRVDRVDQIEWLAVEDVAEPADREGGPGGLVRGLGPDRLRLLDTAALFAHDVFRRRAIDEAELTKQQG